MPVAKICLWCAQPFKARADRAHEIKFCCNQCHFDYRNRPWQQKFFDVGFDIQEGANACWLWRGPRDKRGYGYITSHRKMIVASRASFEIHKNPIPSGLLVCHHCDNPPCVRPDHLFVGDNAANAADRHAKGRDRYVVGSKCHLAQLDEVSVSKILAELESEDCGSLAQRYGVSRKIIDRIARRETWKHVQRGSIT